MRNDRANARVHEIARLIIAGLKLVLGPTMRTVNAGDGSNQGCMMHLLGQLRKDAADLDAVSRSVDGFKFTGHWTPGLWIPSINVTHAPVQPEEDDIFGFGLLGFARASHHLSDGHPEQRRTREAEHAPAGHLVVKASLVHNRS